MADDPLSWSDRKDIAAVPPEPEAMAAAIRKLAMDGKAWRRTQARQLELVAEDCDPAAFGEMIWGLVKKTLL